MRIFWNIVSAAVIFVGVFVLCYIFFSSKYSVLIYSLIATVPAVVWSGVIAAVLTLSGVFSSNWSNTYHLKLQLEHDSNEKAKERKATLRRDVLTLPPRNVPLAV